MAFGQTIFCSPAISLFEEAIMAREVLQAVLQRPNRDRNFELAEDFGRDRAFWVTSNAVDDRR